LFGALFVLGLVAGCGGKAQNTGAPLPPSREVNIKDNQKGKMVADPLPPPPVR
jgi:hypothetical protein